MFKSHFVRPVLWALLLLVFPACATLPVRDPLPQLDPPADFPAWAWEGGIYELSIRNFTPEGTFQAASKNLDRLTDLGIKTLWLMPIHPIGQVERKGTLGSPYSISDYRAVHPDYGTLEDFKAFLSAAHGKGLKVIIDLVANHTAWDHPWIKAHPDWYTRDASGKILPPHPEWLDVADLNYTNPALRKEMTDIMVWWVKEVGIDGYRADTGAMLPMDFWAESLAAVKASVAGDRQILLLAEGDDPRLPASGFHMNYAWPGYWFLKQVWDGEKTALEYGETALNEWMNTGGAPLMRFTTNHDETSWDNPPPLRFGSLEGSRAAAVAAFLMPGIPLVYQGQELGLAVKEDLFSKHTYDWSQGKDSQDFYRSLLKLWTSSKAFKTGALDLQDSGSDQVLTFAREDGGKRYVVAVNAGKESQTLPLPLVWRDKTYRDVFTGKSWAGTELELGPFGFKVLESQ